jgi:predicted dehydrogenase
VTREADEALAVGLAGAGPWARTVHAPMLDAGPETRLAGVWSRTRDAARSLATEHGVPSFATFDELLGACDAVAIAVPPSVQPELAVRAARAGKPLMLEKPLALDVAGAARIAEAVTEAQVGSVMVLTYRYAPNVREFLARADAFAATGGRACFLSGAFLGGPFAGSGWRVEHGALLDVGPHILDLVDAALGPIVRMRAHGDTQRWIGILADHESGAVSEVSISCTAAITPSRTEVEIFGTGGALSVDGRADSRDVVFANLRADFAAVARAGGPHPCDADRGLHLQRLLTMARDALAGR